MALAILKKFAPPPKLKLFFAEAILKKFALPPKLKPLFADAWLKINRASQVEMRVFLPAFGGALVLFILIWLLIPSYRPNISEDTAVKKDASSQLTHSAGDATAPKAQAPAPAQARNYSEREQQAIATNDGMGHDPLLPAPVDALEEGPSQARVPKIADDGRRPWFVYSRPFDRVDPRPRIAVVMADLGTNRLLSESAIDTLPAPVTLIFNSDASTTAWMSRARSLGHEVLISAPMEPIDYPANDPGPGTLLSNIPAQNNLKRLQAAMSKGTGYVGVTTLTGSRFTSATEALQPVLKDIRDRGLLWFDARLVPLASAYAVGQEMKMPVVRTDFRVTADKSREAMDLILADAETSARHAGTATVLIYPSPMMVQEIIDWTKTLPEKGFALAPITAMVE